VTVSISCLPGLADNDGIFPAGGNLRSRTRPRGYIRRIRAAFAKHLFCGNRINSDATLATRDNALTTQRAPNRIAQPSQETAFSHRSTDCKSFFLTQAARTHLHQRRIIGIWNFFPRSRTQRLRRCRINAHILPARAELT
jgi:hypothetical protein